jgi:y4mF family transcriptional regulator
MLTSDPNQTPESLAHRFGKQVRYRRTQLGMTQDDLALASGVGRRFIIELERGKPSCQLGPALMVLATLGLHMPTLSPHDAPADKLGNAGDAA